MELWIVVVIVAACLVTEAFFSGSEMAVLACDKLRLRQRADGGQSGARLLVRMLERPQQLFGVTLVGTNLAVVTSTTVVTLYLVDLHGPEGDRFTIFIMSPLVLLLGELVPKTFFRAQADASAPRVVRPLWFFAKVFTPLTYLMSHVSDAFLRWLRVDEGAHRAFVTRDELQLLVRAEDGGGALPSAERRMIGRIFELAHTPVREVMIPLSDVCAISRTASPKAAIALIRERGFSRLPVFEQRFDDIRGVLHSFDLLSVHDGAIVADYERPTMFVPEQRLVDELLDEMRVRGHGMAIVVDEYGGAVGVATVEDLLEEIVGEIEDEHDPRHAQFRRIGPERFAVSGRISIDEIGNVFGVTIPDGDYQTLAGYVLDRLRRLPVEGERLRLHGATLTVSRVSDRAILEVQLELDAKRGKGPSRGPRPA